MVNFLVSYGTKPVSIMPYNHLGDNDGKNLSVPSTFRSKEISKSNVIVDMVASNRILSEEDEHPDHAVVIKYALAGELKSGDSIKPGNVKYIVPRSAALKALVTRLNSN